MEAKGYMSKLHHNNESKMKCIKALASIMLLISPSKKKNLKNSDFGLKNNKKSKQGTCM